MIVSYTKGTEGVHENRQQTQDPKYLIFPSLATSACGIPTGNKGTEDKCKEMNAYNGGKKRPIQEEQVSQKKNPKCVWPVAKSRASIELAVMNFASVHAT